MGNLLRALVMGLVIGGSVFIAVGAEAQQARMSAADVAKYKADVTQAMANYIAAFNARNPKGIADDVFSNPAVNMGANGVTVDDTAAVEARYKNNIGNLEKSGWQKSQTQSVSVCVMNPNVAFAVSSYTRVKTDGSPHSAGSSTYMFNKGKDGKWRIVMLIGHDSSKVLSCTD